jgi:hypothetical protein
MTGIGSRFETGRSSRHRKFRRAADIAARRIGMVCGIAVCLVAAGTHAAKPPKSIAVMNCALLDDNAPYNDADVTRIQRARIGMISDALRDQLRDRALYRVADNAPADKLFTRLEASQDLNACNGCELEIGRHLDVERIGVCWVQKISNLILNINLRVEDVATGRIVFERSVDIRGNTDQSWRRGIKALVDLLAADQGATQ